MRKNQSPKQHIQVTLPETNKKAPENKPSQKGYFVFQPLLFQGLSLLDLRRVSILGILTALKGNPPDPATHSDREPLTSDLTPPKKLEYLCMTRAPWQQH